MIWSMFATQSGASVDRCPPGKSVPEVFARVIFVVFLFHLCAVEKQLTNDGGGCNADEKRLRNCFVGICSVKSLELLRISSSLPLE